MKVLELNGMLKFYHFGIRLCDYRFMFNPFQAIQIYFITRFLPLTMYIPEGTNVTFCDSLAKTITKSHGL